MDFIYVHETNSNLNFYGNCDVINNEVDSTIIYVCNEGKATKKSGSILNMNDNKIIVHKTLAIGLNSKFTIKENASLKAINNQYENSPYIYDGRQSNKNQEIICL